MRKYLIVAIAALTALVFSAVAIAQTPAPTMSVKITPKKAGTKNKPKNSQINLEITNNDPKRTLSKLTAIHIRHHDVGDEEPNFAGVLLQISERLTPIARGACLITERADHSASDGARCLLVINDEDGRLNGKA